MFLGQMFSFWSSNFDFESNSLFLLHKSELHKFKFAI